MNEQGPDVPLKDFGVGPTKGAPRKFVIFFHDAYGSSLTGKFPPDWGRKYDTQVVHHPWLSKIEQPSRKDRLFIRLGLGTEKASIDNAVAEAYALLASEYLLGDEVIFLIDISPVRDMKSILDPAETLARHLNQGTRPRRPSKLQSSNGGGAVSCGEIPIHCVAARFQQNAESISGLHDYLKSRRDFVLHCGTNASPAPTRFPPGITHIICLAWAHVENNHGSWSCSSTFNLNGDHISREGTHSDFSFIYSTRHVIHYNQDNTPDLYPPTFANAEHPSDAKSNRKPKADVYEMETVTPGFIAYVAVALRYTLSNETSFMESSDTFNYVVFYHEIVTYLESPEFADKTQDLAKRWDDRIFPHKIPALDNPSSMLARFREQRAEAAARGNRASSEDNND